MKIIFVFDGLQVGGIERVGIEYIKLLRKEGINVEVINLRPKLADMVKELPIDVNVIDIPFPRWICRCRYRVIEKKGVWGKVCYCCLKYPLEFIEDVYSAIYKRRLASLETDYMIAFSGHYNDLTFVYHNSNNAKRVAWLHGSEKSYADISDGFLEMYTKFKNLVCLSEQGDEFVRDFNIKNGIKKTKIYNPNNCDDKVLNYEKIRELSRKYGDYILMVGRLAKDKDQETLIRAVRILNEKYGLKEYLVLVGDGTEKDRLYKVAEECGLLGQVVFAGSQSDVQNYYNSAFVYAHSSPAEGLPTVLLEAMYYGKPIVSSNSKPGVEEILQNDCGIITTVGDAEEMADALYKIYDNDNLRNALISKGLRRCKAFEPYYVLGEFLKYLESI